MRLPDLEAWAIFASVVEHRSFSGAADAIGVSKATVSKAVSRLEQRLGQTLFHRTSRRLSLTEGGRTLAEHAQRLLADAVAAEEAAHNSATEPSGLVRVTAPMTLGLLAVAPAVAEFLAENPGIQVDLNLSDAKIDIVAEGIDIALRIADLPDSSLRARRLGPIRAHVVAAPAYLARAGTPTHPSQLGEHACLAYTNVSGPWRFYGPGGAEVTVRPEGPLRANSGDALLPTLRAGLAIGMLPDFIVDRDIADGTLQPILTDWWGPALALHLMTPPGALRPARVERLIEFLTNRFRTICAERPMIEATRPIPVLA